MTDRPDWDQWILQKNAEAKVEELKKSDDVTLTKTKEPPVGKVTAHYDGFKHNNHNYTIKHNGDEVGHMHIQHLADNHVDNPGGAVGGGSEANPNLHVGAEEAALAEHKKLFPNHKIGSDNLTKTSSPEDIKNKIIAAHGDKIKTNWHTASAKWPKYNSSNAHANNIASHIAHKLLGHAKDSGMHVGNEDSTHAAIKGHLMGSLPFS